MKSLSGKHITGKKIRIKFNKCFIVSLVKRKIRHLYKLQLMERIISSNEQLSTMDAIFREHGFFACISCFKNNFSKTIMILI